MSIWKQKRVHTMLVAAAMQRVTGHNVPYGMWWSGAGTYHAATHTNAGNEGGCSPVAYPKTSCRRSTSSV
jgi:hypothetical protein